MKWFGIRWIAIATNNQFQCLDLRKRILPLKHLTRLTMNIRRHNLFCISTEAAQIYYHLQKFKSANIANLLFSSWRRSIVLLKKRRGTLKRKRSANKLLSKAIKWLNKLVHSIVLKSVLSSHVNLIKHSKKKFKNWRHKRTLK